MRYAVTGTQMKQVDRDTIERIGIPSLVLMERAALAVADEAQRQLAGKKRQAAKIWAACGTGNNGADGIAAGRILKGRGCDVTVILAGNLDHATEEHRLQQRIAANLGVTVVRASEFEAESGTCDVIIDAVFGIGLGRNIEGEYRKFMEMLASHREAAVVAVDIPSGIHSDTGAVMGTALRADATVTFGYLKTGLLLYPGKMYAGRVTVADIGFSDVSLERAGYDALVLDSADLVRLPKRREDGNKGTFGKLLLIAGSRGMSGASYLSGLAAYRAGTGLVKILTVPENRMILQTQLPEAIVETYDPETALSDADGFRAFIEGQCDWADTIVMGPGLGRESYVGVLVETVLAHSYVPMVLDADGLNAVAADSRLARYFTENIIVTPHMGEMARLTGKTVAELKQSPAAEARAYAARTGAVCVMKDAATVIADKEGLTYVNASGCSGMAKAGSGDVLAGVIGALLAQGMEVAEAAAWGVYIHGLAGEAASKSLGEHSLLAHDIADYLHRIGHTE